MSDTTTTRPLRAQDIADGQSRLVKVMMARRIIHERAKNNLPWSWKMVAGMLGMKMGTLHKYQREVETLVNPTASDLATKSGNSGRRPNRKLTPQEVTAITGPKLLTNRTRTTGSTPEALRIAIKNGALPEDLRGQIQSRAAQGKPLLTATQMDQVYIPEAAVRHFRAPRNNWLEIASNPGSLQLIVDMVTGEERFIRPGEFLTIDDGTKNFGCCVPLEKPNDPCWLKHKVIVGRFQFLLVVDHRTRFITGFSHTARPRGSYRSEDLTATIHKTFLLHGVPKGMFLEHGASASKLMKETLCRMGVMPIYVKSPHQKIVESVFNKMWTKLSLLGGQVGRFMGEEEEMGRLYESCKRGEKDPRKWFPMLADVLKALNEAIAEHNAELVVSRTYSQQWVPKDFFALEAPQQMRKVSLEDTWMFSPRITDSLKIRKTNIITTVPFMEGHSVQFSFTAPWVSRFIGASVKLFFNPFAPSCVAHAVLQEPFHGHAKDELLGEMVLTHRYSKHQRRMFGYGDDLDDSQQHQLKNAQALHNVTVAMRPDGKPGITTYEIRDGAGNALTIDQGMPTTPATQPANTGPRSTAAAPLPKPARNTETADELAANLRRLNEQMRERDPEFAAYEEE